MAESLNLITVRRKLLPPRRKPLPAHVVIGIEQTDGTTAFMRETDRRAADFHQGPRKEVQLSLGELATTRLTSFFVREFVNGEALDYDCMGLAPYLRGSEDDMVRAARFKHQYGVPTGLQVHPNDLEPGAPYAIRNFFDTDSTHAMVGSNQPTHSLNALGRSVDGGGLLVYAANVHLMDTYEGAFIAPVWREGKPY